MNDMVAAVVNPICPKREWIGGLYGYAEVECAERIPCRRVLFVD